MVYQKLSPRQRNLWVNVLLAVFNLVPVPPLDGSRILDCLIPDKLRPPWEGFFQMGPASLLIVVATLFLLGADIMCWPVEATQQSLDWLAQQVVR